MTSPETLLSLAAKVEAAEGPDHVLAADINEATLRIPCPPDFTASIDAALTLYISVPERVPSNPRLATAEALRQRAEAANGAD